MPIATAALGFVVMFFFGSMTGRIVSQPQQIGKTIKTETSNVRFYDIADRELVGMPYEVKETISECICKEKVSK